MTTISVPINAKLEEFINHMVKTGVGSNKADVVRRALTKYAEDQAVEAVMQSMRELKQGKALKGDLEDVEKFTTFLASTGR